MIETNQREYLWVEKYRPKKIEDCILPIQLKDYFKGVIKSGKIQNMLLVGPPGCGKTTVAYALCNELNIDHIFINCSENGNIDTLRTIIRRFASSVSFVSNYKVIILDEADGLNPNSTQPALRAFIEEFSRNCRFIFTANNGNKIIEPLRKSRLSEISFVFPKEERKELIIEFDKRIKLILENENINYDKKSLAQLIIRYFPDLRKVLTELQRYSINGTIEESIINSIANDSIRFLYRLLKFPEKWNEVRKWVAENQDEDFHLLIRSLFELADEFVKSSSIPQLVLTLAEYDYKHSFAGNKEIQIIALLTELMTNLEFK